MWPSDTCGNCEKSTPSLAKVTCPGCKVVGCKYCMGLPQAKVTAAGKCTICISRMPEYRELMASM
jgi:hypothetical protein